MKKFRLTPISIALASALIIGGATFAARANTPPTKPASVQEEVTTEPGRSITPADEQVISSSAAKVLHHIAQAREAIRAKDGDRAKRELGQAETLLDIIQKTAPTTVVKDKIWTADKKLQYENQEEVSPSSVPIYATLDERVRFTEEQARKAAANSKADTKAEAKPTVADKTGKTSKVDEDLEADATMLYYEELDLPLNATRHMISLAQGELAKNQFTEADRNLRSAMDNVEFVGIYIPEPLVTARLNLQLAHEHYSAGQMADAKADVGRAMAQLEQVAKAGDPAIKPDVEQLLKDAKSMQERMDRSDTTLGPEIKELWHHTKALADRAVEYSSVGWAKLRSHGKIRGDLIEAKRFVADANIDANVGKDTERAKQDLQKAQGYLEKAASDAKGKTAVEVTIQDAKAMVDSMVAGQAKFNPVELEDVLSQLKQAITQL